MTNEDSPKTAPIIESALKAAGEQAKGYIDTGVKAVDTVTDTACVVAKKTKDFVEHHPNLTIAAALGVGAVAGYLLHHPKNVETKPVKP